MANVLPIAAQKRVWRMYRARFIIVGSFVLLGLSAIGGVALLPSYLALEIAAPAPVATSAPRNDTVDPVAIARTQALLLQIGPVVSATSSPSTTITAALAARPAGLVVDSIGYTSEVPAKIVLGGTANRDQINAYRNALLATGRFSGVSVPVGALVGAEGGRFSITLTTI